MVSETRSSQPRVLILTGPTAAGKTSLALELARRHKKIELVNADSMLVYRQMDIGTAKPTPEELGQVPHHLINIRDPSESFTAGDFSREVDEAIQDIHGRGKRALIVGGTGFYLKALLYGLWEGPKTSEEFRKKIEAEPSSVLYERLYQVDSEAALRIGVNDRYRLVRSLEIYELSGKTPSQLQEEHSKTPDPKFVLWVVDRDDEEIKKRIHQRCEQMIRDGLLDETRQVRESYPESRALQAIGYFQAIQYLDGIRPAGRKVREGLTGLADEIELATRQLVKSQRTWFKSQLAKMPEGLRFILDDQKPALISEFEKIYP